MPRDRRVVLRALSEKGFDEKSKRDHKFFFFVHEGLTQAVFTKVSLGSSHREISDSNLGKMARQLRLTRKELDELVDCPMSRQDYEKVLLAGGYISL